MRKTHLIIAVLGVVFLGVVAFADDKAAAPADTAAAPANPAAADLTAPQRMSYSFGAQIGKSLKNANQELERDYFLKGLSDAMDGKPLLLTEEEMRQVINDFRKEAMLKQQEEMRKKGDENLAKQKAFLEENAKKEGVVALPSGLQYKVLQEGTGPIPTATDRVKVNYRGTFLDGKEFDSSAKHGGGPIEMQVNKVIKGWTEALQLMKVGSKMELYIPSELAYGPKGSGIIEPNQMLIFEIELLEILPTQTIEVPPMPSQPTEGAQGSQ